MGFHTYDVARADNLEDSGRYEYCSAEELLGAADLSAEDRVLDVGSGTGFYTDVLAGVADRVYAVDLQPAMAAYYRDKGVPAEVSPVAADAGTLPLPDDAVDAAVSARFGSDSPGSAFMGRLRGSG